MRLLIAGGGTGGHVFPALAVAQQLQRQRPDSLVLFVGADGGLETRLVPQHGFRLETLAVGKLKGTRLLGRLQTLAGLGPAVIRAGAILRSFSPDVVVGVGGYASAPVVLAARLLRRPIVLLEQNAIPGVTNRTLARVADRVVVAYAQSAAHLPRGRAVHLGNPLRPDLVSALEAPRVSPPSGQRRLLVLGGSQGARPINELMIAAAPALVEKIGADRLAIRHQTGPKDHARVVEAYGDQPALRAEAFIEDTAAAYRDADLALTRAGATTLAELAVAGLPAVLVPYPFAADDHQSANAAPLGEAGGAVVVAQEQLSAPRLVDLLGGLLGDVERLRHMRQRMLLCGRPRAAEDVVDLLCELAASRAGRTSPR